MNVGMLVLVLGVVLFAALHIIPSLPAARAALVGRMGEGGYKAGFFALGFLSIALMAHGYGVARAEGERIDLWYPPIATRHVAIMLLAPVFPLVFAAFTNGIIKAKLKHPMLVAVKLWAFAHLIANGTLADVVLFGGILALAVFLRISLKRRGKTGGTPNPDRRADLLPVAAGLAAYVLVAWKLHGWLIGVPVV